MVSLIFYSTSSSLVAWNPWNDVEHFWQATSKVHGTILGRSFKANANREAPDSSHRVGLHLSHILCEFPLFSLVPASNLSVSMFCVTWQTASPMYPNIQRFLSWITDSLGDCRGCKPTSACKCFLCPMILHLHPFRKDFNGTDLYMILILLCLIS
jgi:hypothetical protein